MEGSITQLGLSNYLINKKSPAVSFFQHTYKNYTNYAKDVRVLSFKNNFQFGQTADFSIDEDGKYGDFITNVVIQVILPDISGYTNSTGKSIGYCNGVGNALARNIVLTIGGNIIDQQSSEWLDIWSQLSVKPGCQPAYSTMVQKYDDNTFTTTSFQGGTVYIPLQFWFCRNISNKNSSMILPLLNLYDSTIDITIDVRNFNEIVVSEDGNLTGIPTGLSIIDSNIILDYVILEEIERVHFLKMPKQLLLMNQIQTYKYDLQGGITSSTFSLKSLRYLVSELLIVVRRNDSATANNYFNYSNSLSTLNKSNPIKTIRLQFDGRDRIKKTDANVYSLLEPAKIHTNAPLNAFIHCIGFSLEAEKLDQPNGVCNFSELQEPLLSLEFNTGLPACTLFVFAVNYNVLQTMQGVGYLLHMLSKGIPTTLDSLACTYTPSQLNEDYNQKMNTTPKGTQPQLNNYDNPYKV